MSGGQSVPTADKGPQEQLAQKPPIFVFRVIVFAPPVEKNNPLKTCLKYLSLSSCLTFYFRRNLCRTSLNKAELCTVGWREMQYIETRKKAQLMLYDCLLN